PIGAVTGLGSTGNGTTPLYPITMAVLIAAIAAVGAGRWLDLRYRRSPRGMEDEAQQLERADFVVSVTLLPPAQFGR
ncbi:MAG: hypothetical protein ACOVOU_02415, partial [Rubrivivax sp.]